MSQKIKYKDQKQLKYKKNLMIFTIILSISLLVCLVVFNSINVKNIEEESIAIGNFNSIKDILEYYGCKYKGEKNSNEENFTLDIEAVFKYDLYSGDESNEDFYNNIIEEIAKFLNYKSFRILDNKKEEKIEIKVFGDGSKIEKIVINGIEDYFIYMDSQINLSKYKELKTTEISVQSSELADCIENGWSKDTNFGNRETIFKNYFIYFDEGIKARKINGRIYNIIFTDKYANQVVGGFNVGTNHDVIINKLGTPTFKNEDESIIGYKSNDIYVFFEKNQISVYRNTKEEGFDEFFSLVDKFLNDTYSLLEFMNELTYIWPDYDEYTYSEDTVFLSYPNKGIDIKINYDNMNGIILYNNIPVNHENINKYLKNTEFIAQLQVDNVFNAEKRRVENEKKFNKQSEESQEKFEKENNRNRSKTYDYYMKTSDNDNIMCVYFISKDKQFPDCELNESISSYIWINDYCFVYSKMKKGIYYYDLKNQVKGTLITGEELYDIKSYENSILQYDETSLQVEY